MKKDRSDNLDQLDLVDNYVKSERGIEPDPYLVTKLMSRIDSLERVEAEFAPEFRENHIFFSTLYRVAIAAGIALILFLGVSIGSSYKGSLNNEIALNINDNQIENLHLYQGEE
ncbi:MAG: hypothetical protein CVU13_06485 [Bacteroidetes bacterium HGW-Bacteroidetes-8]|jgi:hypothetical protein|nr:MAG: hypothetical protein CVU13_06485 [Bacteroidetes bacterium HGW-Bacteroidetes-8]